MKLKQHYTGSTLIEEAEILAQALKRSLGSYRETIRQTLQSMQFTFVRMRASKELKKSLRLKLRKRDDANGEVASNLELELMVIVTGNTRAGRKRASKYCSILKILDQDGIKPKDTAKVIKDRGGIEKILSRKDKPSRIDEREGDKEPQPPEFRPSTNDQFIERTLLLKLSDDQQIRQAGFGSRLILNVDRINHPTAFLKVLRVRERKPQSPPADW